MARGSKRKPPVPRASGAMTERVNVLRKDVDDHSDTLYGNGDRGLKERVLLAEQRIQQHGETFEEMKSAAAAVRADVRKGLITVIGGLVVAFLCFIGSLLVMYFQDDGESPAAVRAIVQQTVDAMREPN